MEPTLTTLVMGMIGFSKEDIKLIPRQEFYNFLFRLSKKDEFEDYFEGIYFDKLTEKNVYSKQIEAIFFRLGTGNIALQEGFRFENLIFPQRSKKAIQNYLIKFYPRHIDFMKKTAEELNQHKY